MVSGAYLSLAGLAAQLTQLSIVRLNLHTVQSERELTAHTLRPTTGLLQLLQNRIIIG